MRIIIFLTVCALMTACSSLKSIKEDINTVSKNIKEASVDINHVSNDISSIRESVLPIDSLSIQLISGVLQKLSEDGTKDTLEVLIEEFNLLLADLNT